MELFLSCDWGTSSFRLRLIQAPDLDTLAVQQSSQGIKSVFLDWEAHGPANRPGRLDFYLQVLRNAIIALEEDTGQSLRDIPVLISGMASSSIGMLELPYGTLPFTTDGAHAYTQEIPATAVFPNDILLISGVRSDHDVMRGEETQLVGCLTTDIYNGVFIFPGTHSKHIYVEDRQVKDFRTFMTGEVFDLLSKHSILKSAVEGQESGFDENSFRKGVHDATASALLHTLFRVRTNQLFNRLTNTQNADYLSGLLIGAELKELLPADALAVYLCGGAHLQHRYAAALKALGHTKAAVLSAASVDDAVVKGQYQIWKRLKVNNAT